MGLKRSQNFFMLSDSSRKILVSTSGLIQILGLITHCLTRGTEHPFRCLDEKLGCLETGKRQNPLNTKSVWKQAKHQNPLNTKSVWKEENSKIL